MNEAKYLQKLLAYFDFMLQSEVDCFNVAYVLQPDTNITIVRKTAMQDNVAKIADRSNNIY